MDLSEFRIAGEFMCDDARWRCTDIGTRTVIAIRVDEATIRTAYPDGSTSTRTVPGEEADAMGSFRGPPYGVVERVFDEDDREICEPAPESEDSFVRLIGGLQSAVAHAEGRSFHADVAPSEDRPMSSMALHDLGAIHVALIDARRRLAHQYEQELCLTSSPSELAPEAILRMGASLKAVQDQIEAVERATAEEVEAAKREEALARPRTDPATLPTTANTSRSRRP